jgi:hypothetical protein
LITIRRDPVRVKVSGADCGLTPGEKQIVAGAQFDGAVAAAGKGLENICGG